MSGWRLGMRVNTALSRYILFSHSHTRSFTVSCLVYATSIQNYFSISICLSLSLSLCLSLSFSHSFSSLLSRCLCLTPPFISITLYLTLSHSLNASFSVFYLSFPLTALPCILFNPLFIIQQSRLSVM